MKNFRSSGKLLLTAEYIVLDGALALALPTQMGQKLSVEKNKQDFIHWQSFCKNKLWLDLKIDTNNWEILSANLPDRAHFIRDTLKNISKISPRNCFEQGLNFTANLEFPAHFGLGSSSTLMTNLAKWANIDAFLLNEISLGGSGYDVAVAMENSPILYQIKNEERFINKVNFLPDFRKDLIFIHLNQKQDSREGIRLYQSKPKSPALIEEFSQLTKSVLEAQNIDDFSYLMELHEENLFRFLGLEKVKNRYFSDCPVFVKSLGAWGGDFVMARKFDDYQNYFQQKGFHTIFDWEEMILDK